MTEINLKKQERALPNEGAQEARIARIIELGQQPQNPNSNFKKEITPFQLYFMYELAQDKLMYQGKEMPMFINQRINLSGGPKSHLFKILQATNLHKNESVFLGDLIGKPILLNIVHEHTPKGTFANINGVGPVPKSLEKNVPPLVADGYYFDWSNPDPETFNKLSDHIKKLLQKAENFEGSLVQKLLEAEKAGVSPKDLPF